MINFEEEIKKFEPSLEVSKLEDTIIKSEMSDFNDIIMGILKKQKASEAEQNKVAAFESKSNIQMADINLEQTEFPEGEYSEEEFDEEMYIAPEYNINHDK